jgi:hypothetical protein
VFGREVGTVQRQLPWSRLPEAWKVPEAEKDTPPLIRPDTCRGACTCRCQRQPLVAEEEARMIDGCQWW